MPRHEHLLLLDIGNTNTKIGLSRDGSLLEAFVFPTNPCDTADSWGFRVLEICRRLELDPGALSAWVVCSVVPPMDVQIRRACHRYSGCPVLFVPSDLGVPLQNRYALPDEVGADRLVTAFAARSIFDTPSVVVVDFGTATTLDCVQGNAYLGGLICPGVHTSAAGLGRLTAKLPHVGLELEHPSLRIGESTATSLNNGFIFGFASMVQGLCRKLSQQLENPVSVVATGGFAQIIQPVCPCLEHIRPDLLLSGLAHIHQQGLDSPV